MNRLPDVQAIATLRRKIKDFVMVNNRRTAHSTGHWILDACSSGIHPTSLVGVAQADGSTTYDTAAGRLVERKGILALEEAPL